MVLGIPEIHLFPRIAIVSRMVVRLHDLCEDVTRISIPEETRIERKLYVLIVLCNYSYSVNECKERAAHCRTEELLRD